MGTHTPTHRLASTSRMCTAISPGQWQPWTAVSPLLGLIRARAEEWLLHPRQVHNVHINLALFLFYH